MELLFRKYFWTVNLAFLALAAFLSARTANTVIAGQIAAPAVAEAPAASSASRSPVRGGLAQIDLERTARLFGIELPKEEPEAAAVPVSPTFDPNAEAVRSSLRATLIGTMVANRAEWSFATIRDDASRETGLYLPGDRLMGAEIVSIERLRVVLNNEGRKEYIAIGDGPAPAPPAQVSVQAPAAPAPAAGVDDGSIRQIDENNYEISRAEIDKQLSNLNQIATQARIVPSFKNGVANGFKLFSIRPNSLYSKIGIQNGDVIRRINGYEINSPDKALEIYSKLKEANRIEIELERRGQSINRSYNIR